MNADTATPTTPPTPAPVGGPLPVVPAPGDTTPAVPHAPAEPNALMDGAKKVWEGLKAGKVGSPKLIALVLAVAAILGAWWFLSRASTQSDSALWFGFDSALSNDRLKTFADEPTNTNTLAAKIAKLNDVRLRRDTLLGKMTRPKLADRVEAADTLEKVRDEFAELAGQLGKDPTLKAKAFSEAAEIEMGLVGVPKKGVTAMGGDEKGKGRGQLDKYADLLRKAAEAIGPNTDAGKGFIADADKYSKDPEAAQLYRQLGTFHAKFNDPDPLPPTTTPDPNTPKLPPGIGGGGTTPTTTPGDLPKPPVNFPEEKK